MRAIDADHLRQWILSRVFKTQLSVADVIDQIDREDTIKPETGYWISARDEDGRHMWLICSECRAKETNLKAKYCPVCGRKMA